MLRRFVLVVFHHVYTSLFVLLMIKSCLADNNDNNTNQTTLSPTPQTTLGPFEWDLYPIGGTSVAHFGDETMFEEVEFSYNISLRDYDVVVYEYDCLTGPVDKTIINVTHKLTPTSATHGVVAVDLDIIQTNITNATNIWKQTVPEKASIELCVRIDLFMNGVEKNHSVTFHETKYRINLDLTAGFSVSDVVETNRTDAVEIEEEVILAYDIVAYQCDPNTSPQVETPSTLTQGGVLIACIRTNSSNAYVTDIISFVITQEESGTAVTVTAISETSGSNGLTDVDCDSVPGMCIVQSQLFSDFFSSRDPGDITATGKAVIALGTETASSSRRKLEEEEDGNGLEEKPFDVKVPLQAPPDNSKPPRDWDKYMWNPEWDSTTSSSVILSSNNIVAFLVVISTTVLSALP